MLILAPLVGVLGGLLLAYPYQMNQDESVRLLAHVVSKYIVRLAKVPQSSVDQMSPADLNAAAWLVAGFFLQA
ncbi:phage tail assembly protein [Escherichia coli]